MLSPSKSGLPFPLSLVKKRIYLGTHLKEEFTDLFQSYKAGEHFANG